MKKMNFLTILLVVGAFTASSLSFTGCDKKTSKNKNGFEEVIEADSEWFNVETNQLEIPSEVSETRTSIISKTVFNDQLLSVLSANNNAYLLFNSLDGKLNNSIKLPGTSTVSVGFSYRFHRSGDSLLLSTTKDDYTVSTHTTKLQKIDLDNNTIIDEDINVDDAYLYGCALGKENKDQGFEAFNNLYVGDKLISILRNTTKNEQRLAITDKNNDIQNINVKDTFNLNEDSKLMEMFPISSDEVLLAVYNNDECYTFYSFNLQNNIANEFKATEDFSDIIIHAINTYITDSDKNVIVNSNGKLSKLNFKEQKAEEIFNFGNAYINPALMKSASVVSTENGKYVFLANTPHNNEQNTIDIIIFTNSKENPNIGKDVITLASMEPNGLSQNIGNAIYNFNKSSDKFFVKYAPEYEIESKYDGTRNNDAEQKIQTQTSELIEKLSNDILDGTAPDIILDAYDNELLNNDRYFEDLSSHELDKNVFFTNIIDATKTNDKLYQIPLSFCLDAIATRSDNVTSDTVGFDFDSYKTFVKQKCNGKDPILYSIAAYTAPDYNNDLELKLLLRDMLKTMEEPIIKNNKINIDNDEFQAIIKYVKDNKQNNEKLTFGSIGDTVRQDSFSIDTYSNYLSQSCENMKFLGLPGTKARTPAATIKNSAGITVTSKHKEAAWEFIENLLNNENSTQDFGITPAISINKNKNNATIKATATKLKRSESDFNFINEMVENVKSIERIDPSIFNIIFEELQPYFNDDKSFDDIIKIITDRCNKFLDENK